MDFSGSKSGNQVDYLRQIIDEQLADLHTCIPALVETFDASTQMLECTPMIRARLKDQGGNESTELRPKLVKIPLNTPYVRMLGFSLTMPITPGDEVLLIFAERGLDYWQETGDYSDPPEDHSARMHDWTDGIAIVGPIAKPDAVVDYQIDCTELRNRDRTTALSIWEDETELRSSPGSFQHQKPNGDVDTEIANNENKKVDVNRNLEVVGISTEFAIVGKNTSVGGYKNELIGAGEDVLTVGNSSQSSYLSRTEYAGLNITKYANGTFDIIAGTTVRIMAPTVNVCGNVVISGNLKVSGTITERSGTAASCPTAPVLPLPPTIPSFTDPEKKGP